MAKRQIVIHRAQPKETRIQNTIIWDNSLSPMARFALIAMLSLPESWDYSVRGMAAMLGVSKDTMTKYLQELEKAGYLKRSQAHGQSGQFSACAYILTDTPGDFGEDPCPKNSDTAEEDASPCPSLPAPVKPAPENSPQKKRTEEKKRTEQKPPIIPPGILGQCEAYAAGDRELLDAIAGLLINRASLRPKPKPVVTERAMSGILRQLDKLSAGDRAAKLRLLDEATQHNWLTVYPLRRDESGGSPPGGAFGERTAGDDGGQDGI